MKAAVDAQFRAAPEAMVDRRQRVLVTGRSANNRVINFAADPALVGHYVDVVGSAALSHSLRGALCA